jgi:hypothetical protein
MSCTTISEVADGVQQGDGTQITANTVEHSSPAQVLAQTSPRSHSRCSTELPIEADVAMTGLLPKASRTCIYSVSNSFRGRRVFKTEPNY